MCNSAIVQFLVGAEYMTFPKIGRQFIDYFPRNLDMFPILKTQQP